MTSLLIKNSGLNQKRQIMQILNLIQCLNLGGMEQSVYILMEQTKDRLSWTVQSVTPAGAGRDKVERLKIPVNDSTYKGKFGWRSFGSLYKKVYGFRGETVLITGPTLTSCLVTKFHPAKKILDVHFCHQEGWFNQIKWKLFYWLFGSDYDTIIFHSPFVQHEAEQLAPWLGYKYQTILYSTDFYGIPTPDERTAARRHFGLTEDAFVIGNAGWLIDRKRFDVFLETCSEVIKQYPNVLCLIAGDGPQKETLQKLSQKLGIEKNVEFLGWQEDLHLFYKSLNLLLFNSNSDAFGRTVMESMGYGIPVVASVVEGGTDAVIKQGKNGYLLQRHDIALLSKYCLQLISNSDLYKTFQEAAIETIQREFSTQRYVNDYLKIFGQTDNCNIENAA